MVIVSNSKLANHEIMLPVQFHSCETYAKVLCCCNCFQNDFLWKAPAFWLPFCLFTKICNSTVPDLAPEFVNWYFNFQVNFATCGRESAFSHFSHLVSLDFLRFVMAITIAGEVTGNELTGLNNQESNIHTQLLQFSQFSIKWMTVSVLLYSL